VKTDQRRFEYVLSPGRIGQMELPNRVVLPAMDMNLCDDGAITAGDVEHFVARARGGTGLVITGAAAVAFPRGAASRHQPGLSDDRFLPGLRSLADGIHGGGGRICVQLCHHGKTSGVDTADGRPLLVPTKPTGGLDLRALVDNTPDELMRLAAASSGRPPSFQEATEDDLAWVIGQFADAACRVQSAGIDAVEVHAAHGYLLSLFLSNGYNRRTDRWGGSIENRARLTCEVVRAIRQRVGPDYPVLVRVNGHEYGPDGGLRVSEAAAAAQLIEAAGADAIHVSANAHNPFADFTDGPLPSTVGQYRGFAAEVKRSVTIPVIAVGRVLPELADEMIEQGDCDFVSMGRQLLADPELVAKLRAGRRESVRPCINCYVCVEQNFFDATPKCAVNPALGAEWLAEAGTGSVVRDVVVIGGGPAGMEAARRCALRGHCVTLLEKGLRLGGTAWFSQLTTPANQPLVEWLVHELEVVGVRVRTGVEATAEVIRSIASDPVVIVATGARRDRPDIPGADRSHVFTGDDLRSMVTGDGDAATGRLVGAALKVGRKLHLTDDPARLRKLSKTWMPVGKRVVVVGGGLVGLELAEFLAERDRAVTVLEEGPALGLPMAMPRRWTSVRRAEQHGVALVRNAMVTEIGADTVTYRVADGEAITVGADAVVVAGRVLPDTRLADELRVEGFDARVAGDAAEVGYIEGAIHSAWAVAAGV
jgi:2,4-dienoyl-CoA reductase-like NADH-dependent reductase (Old Yellow Enzyme family)/NADPH-dependent 2,4-dienoyl-CoA reductase/sulfur reductase-like enzyme